jgi:hypothetical protein
VAFVRKNGYPNKNLLGELYKNNECVHAAAGVILLHNSHRLVNEKEFFDLFINEVKIGNMKKEMFILTIDKYYWARSHGANVLYGVSIWKTLFKE